MMRSVQLRHCWSPQRLFAMLKDCQARERESWRNSLLAYPSNQVVEVGPSDRDCAVTWMSGLSTRFQFYPETFFLAVHSLDRFLTSVKSRPKYLKCIAVTCLYVASKIIEEEEHIPGTKELVDLSKSGCRPRDILRMERIILTKLNWEFHTPTPLTYLEIFHALAFCRSTKSTSGSDLYVEKPDFLSRHLIQLTMELQHIICHYSLALFPSSAIALALLSLRIQDLSMESYHWATITSKIQALSRIETSDLMRCRDTLLSLTKKKQHNINPNNLVYVITAPNQGVVGSEAEKRNVRHLSLQGGPVKRKANDARPATLPDRIKKFHCTEDVQDNCMADADVGTVDCDADMELVQWQPILASGSPNFSQESGVCADLLKYTTVTESGRTSTDIQNGKEKQGKTNCPPLVKAGEPIATDFLANDGISEVIDWDASHSAGSYNCGMLYESDSEKTYTASEGEEDERTEKLQTQHKRPLTYAEIVKFGLLDMTTAVSMNS